MKSKYTIGAMIGNAISTHILEVMQGICQAAKSMNANVLFFLGIHCGFYYKLNELEDIDKDFVKKAQPGDIIVAKKNFGCGSSREHAPIAIKACGISCVIASTYARIFYRNAINIGMPILECPEAAEDIQDGDEVSVDFDTGLISNLTTGKTYQAQPFPPFIQNIIQKGGLLNSIAK